MTIVDPNKPPLICLENAEGFEFIIVKQRQWEIITFSLFAVVFMILGIYNLINKISVPYTLENASDKIFLYSKFVFFILYGIIPLSGLLYIESYTQTIIITKFNLYFSKKNIYCSRKYDYKTASIRGLRYIPSTESKITNFSI